MQIYDIIKGEQAAERSAYEYDQTAARANLQIYMNAITNGNLSYSQLSGTQKLAVQKLEIQSGFPVGTMANLQMSPKDKILAFSDDKTQAIVVGANGQFSTISTGITKSTTGTASERAPNDALAAMQADVKAGVTFTELYARYHNQLQEYQIRNAYNAGPMAKQWGPAKETSAQLQTTAAQAQKISESASIGQDLKDAATAVGSGVALEDVRKRFIETHPSSASVFDSYFGL